ncbi:Athe_2463 domain-containing protein [Paenibacillus sp. GCM10027627]|uniref:Athe_2463 domain-containing protein n=1 Tax=unclassified Paenibacillus TaxID=185978 RepID=UPI003627AC69
MRKRNKKLALLLLITYLLSFTEFIPFEWFKMESVDAAPSAVNGFPNTCKYDPNIDGPIPSHVKPCSTNGFKFNSNYYYKTWVLSSEPYKTSPQRKLVVYGNVDSVGDIQDFKKGWQPGGPGSEIFTEGHFYAFSPNDGGMTFGEYRYLGFTQDGNLFSNIHFINDANSGNKLSSKHWVYTPWSDLPSWYKRKPTTPGAIYKNDSNVTSDKFRNIRDYLNEALGFKITQGVKYADRYKVLSGTENQDPRLYMSIEQAPTTREKGSGTMYHYSWETHSLWYHTYTLPKMDDTPKIPVPVACVAQPVDNKPIKIGKSNTVSVQVKVVGTLQDELFYGDPYDMFSMYSRDDVKSWRLDMQDKATGTYKQLSSQNAKDGVIVKDNKASAIFTVNVDLNKLDKSNDKMWKFKTNAGAFATYYNHTSSKPAISSQYCNLEINVEPTKKSPMLSDFGVVETIQFEKKSSFVKEMVGYQDFSYGKEVDYYEFEIISESDGTKQTKKYNPAIPEVKAPKTGYLDQASVNNFLYGFMASKFIGEEVTSTTAIQKTFIIKQTIVDKDSTVNNKSERVRNVTILHTPVAGCKPDDPSLMTPKQFISPKADWPLDWYDVVPFPVSDAPPDLVPAKSCETPADYSEFKKEVYIDGKRISADAFYGGQYVFGEELAGLREVTATFTAPDGSVSHKTMYVVVHPTKPNVAIKLEGLYKQNRTMSAIDRSAETNDPWVEERAPLEITSFSFVKANDPNLKCRTGYCENNLSEKMFLYKKPGNYQFSISAKRVINYPGGSITRYSDPYVVDYQILPDHKPAISAHVYTPQGSRLDELQLSYDVESTDGDFISEKQLKVYYNSNNDGTFDKLVYETKDDITALPKFTQLGQYEIVIDAKEGTDQDRLMEFITPADDQKHQKKSYFFIDNYAPTSDLYIDVPNEKADMDVYFMLDQHLKQGSTDYVRNNKVTLTNNFNTANMLANIGIWDMRTYMDPQSASTSRGTGTSYPPSSISYSSNGYSGTLSRTNVSNTPYQQDDGRYVKVTDSMTATDSCSHTKSYSYDKKGNYSITYDSGACPSSKGYSSGGYSGTLSRTGETGSGCPSSGTPGSSCTGSWTAYYAGTVTRTRDVWESDWNTYDSYTGYYAGTIHKPIRQPYDTSYMRAVPTKYVVYISDSTISELPDLQNVMQKHNAHLILVGTNEMKAQIKHDKFIINDGDIGQVVDQVISYISESNPANPKLLRLVGESIETVTATFDAEGDPIPDSNNQLQITQDPNYYDNSMGFDSWGGKSLISEMSAANWRPYESIVTLNKPGKYQFIRRTKDLPTTDPNFDMYGYYSNESAIDVFVHRRPIADVTLDFDYIPASNTYKSTWVDLSYDLDHNITRAATDRGIQQRSIKLTNKGTSEVFTRIPAELPPGTYVLDYMAQDIEGAWSLPIQKTYVLPDTVPVQFKSNLQTQYNGFSLNSVPASENLVANQLWTRYPYSVSLQMTMGSVLSRSIPYYTGTKTGNDINWKNETFTIPNTTPDGLYTFRIRANGSVAGSYAENTYSVRVETPINLYGQINTLSASKNVTSLVRGDTYELYAGTTKYPDASVNNNATQVTMFKGTPYQQIVTLASTTNNTNGYGSKTWNKTFTVGNIPEGTYTFEWQSRTPNGNIETVRKTIEVVNQNFQVIDVVPDIEYYVPDIDKPDQKYFIVGKEGVASYDVNVRVSKPIGGGSNNVTVRLKVEGYNKTVVLEKVVNVGFNVTTVTFEDIPNITEDELRAYQTDKGKMRYSTLRFTAELISGVSETTLTDNIKKNTTFTGEKINSQLID